MNFDEFSHRIKEISSKIDIVLTDEQVENYYKYMDMLIEWNNKINLTAITEPDEVITKHFIDSITINKFIDKNKKLIDVGTGAGFPGVPVSIIRNDLDIILVDSLNKRINFLENLKDVLKLNNIKPIHARVEEFAKNKQYREKFDYATSRAVAPLNVLLEYLLPFVKVGGYCICMKGSNIEDEQKDASKALEVLGGKIEKIEEFCLPETNMKRNIILVKKVKNTPNKYPRKPGTPSKDPLI